MCMVFTMCALCYKKSTLFCQSQKVWYNVPVEALQQSGLKSGGGSAAPQIVNRLPRRSSNGAETGKSPASAKLQRSEDGFIVNPLSAPRGISVEQAATMLRYSRMTILRMIADGSLVAWKPRGPRGRKWLIDEVSLGALQAAMVQAARTKAAPVQTALLQGELPLW